MLEQVECTSFNNRFYEIQEKLEVKISGGTWNRQH